MGGRQGCTPNPPRRRGTKGATVRDPVLSVVCEPCGRRERYDVEGLKRQYGGDMKMPDLLAGLRSGSRKATFPIRSQYTQRVEAIDQAEETRISHLLREGPHRITHRRCDLMAVLEHQESRWFGK